MVDPTATANPRAIRRALVNAFVHSWDAYHSFAAAADEIDSRTGRGTNAAAGGVALTLVEALDTAVLMRRSGRVALAIDLVCNRTWHTLQPRAVAASTARLLGGLLAAHDLTNRSCLLHAAVAVGGLLLPRLDAAPCTNVVEYARLSALTGDPRFRRAWGTCRAAAAAPNTLNGRGHSAPHASVLPLHLLDGARDPRADDYNRLVEHVRTRFVRRIAGLDFLVDARSTMTQAACAFPGTLALGVLRNASARPAADVELARRLLSGCYALHADNAATGLPPEVVRLAPNGQRVLDPRFRLRADTVGSIFYMWRLTRSRVYRDWAWKIFRSIEACCKGTYGFSSLENVRAVRARSRSSEAQPSWWMGAVLKYLFLTFSADQLLPLERYVLTTEAHPLRVGPPAAGGNATR